MTVDLIDDRYWGKATPDTEDVMWGIQKSSPAHWWLRRLPKEPALREWIQLVGPEMKLRIEKA